MHYMLQYDTFCPFSRPSSHPTDRNTRHRVTPFFLAATKTLQT